MVKISFTQHYFFLKIAIFKIIKKIIVAEVCGLEQLHLYEFVEKNIITLKKLNCFQKKYIIYILGEAEISFVLSKQCTYKISHFVEH